MKVHLKALTGLRFFAAFYVVIYHVVKPYLGDVPLVAKNIVSSGEVAVGLFFILSGFILTYTHVNSDGTINTSKRVFWASRVARIYPVYLLGVFLAGPYSIKALLDHSPMPVGAVGAATITLLQAWVPDIALRWNAPGWSLSAEAFFYLLFPWIVGPLYRSSRRSAIILIAMLWFLGLVAPSVYAFLQPDVVDTGRNFWAHFVMYNPILRLPEFLIGILLARLYVDRENFLFCFSHASNVAVVALALALASSSMLPFPVYNINLLAPIMALLIYGLASGEGWIGQFLSRPWLIVLGESSFALYVLHMPLWNLLFAVTKRVAPNMISLQLAIISVLGSVVISILVFRNFESPANRYLRKILSIGKSRVTHSS